MWKDIQDQSLVVMSGICLLLQTVMSSFGILFQIRMTSESYLNSLTSSLKFGPTSSLVMSSSFGFTRMNSLYTQTLFCFFQTYIPGSPRVLSWPLFWGKLMAPFMAIPIPALYYIILLRHFYVHCKFIKWKNKH